MKIKHILANLVIAASMTGLATATTQAADLTVGANIGNVPWEFQDAAGDYVGFEIELVNEIAKRLGKTVAIENIPFNGLFPAIDSGRIDMAVSSITITQKRLQSLTFAQPYYDSDQSLTVLVASGVTGTADLKGKTVGVDTASTGDIWATAHEAELGFAGISRYEGLVPAMLDLQAGRIDGYISDIPALLYYTKDKPEMKVVERILTGERYSVMFSKDNPLATEVNAVITTLKQEGYVAALHEKWFGAVAEDTTSTVMVMDMPQAE